MWRTHALACALAAWGASSDQPARSEPLEAEIRRVRAEAVKVLSEQDQPAASARLDRAQAALAAGRTYLALYELQGPFELVAGHRLAALEKEFPTHAAFERKWKDMGPPQAPSTARARIVFVEALAQSAEARAAATYRASLPYADDARLRSGLYYLGESHAMVRFAALCRSAGFPAGAGPGPSLGSIEAHLAAHEKAVVKAYDSAPETVRVRYLAIHVGIKVARTLDEQRRHEGALLQYLLSRFRFAVARSLGAPEPSAPAVAQRLEAFRLPPGVDHSIGEFLLQLAAAANGGSDPGPRGAAAILDDVLPAYFRVMNE